MPRRPRQESTGNNGKGKELSIFERGQIIGLARAKWNAQAISNELGINPRTVRQTIQKHPEREDGKSKARTGRPRILSKSDVRHIIAIINEDPFITYRAIKLKLLLTCSDRTISSALQESGYGHWKDQKRPQSEPQHAT
jgi:transposase